MEALTDVAEQLALSHSRKRFWKMNSAATSGDVRGHKLPITQKTEPQNSGGAHVWREERGA